MAEKAVNNQVNSFVQGSSAMNSVNYSLFQCDFSRNALFSLVINLLNN